MNRWIMIVLFLAGMGLGAGWVGPGAKNFLTNAHADSGSLTNFTVETHQGVVALYVTQHLQEFFGSRKMYDRKVIRIEPNPDGTEFKAVLKSVFLMNE